MQIWLNFSGPDLFDSLLHIEQMGGTIAREDVSTVFSLIIDTFPN